MISSIINKIFLLKQKSDRENTLVLKNSWEIVCQFPLNEKALNSFKLLGPLGETDDSNLPQ